MKTLLQSLVPIPARGRMSNGRSAWESLRESHQFVRGLDPEGYRLEVTEEGIRIQASGERGRFMARQTLRQLKLLSPATCPHMEIEDEPAFPIRGYMLDISRCKVPSMEHLFRLVDLLALFKYNQLQLYTEHTFAYKGHEVVWEDASPMTPNEVRQLREYCAGRFIELVPNQNALGHMERWLRHDPYLDLAESPYGFEHPILGWRPHGSVLYPDSEALDFIDGLLEQLLPCFKSDWVHLGCDEPWELGQGRSADRASSEGRHVLYREHLLGLNTLLEKRGKRMLFWSDELRQDPSRILEFPEEMVPVVWGYERDHPFDEECRVYAGAGRTFLIAPGDSSWNSHSARLDTAFPNIRRATMAAREHHAAGLLLTSWGDNGHQQVWPTQLGGLVIFASAAWNPEGIDALDLAAALNAFIFKDPEGAMGQFWHDFGQLDTHVPEPLHLHNKSFSFEALTAQRGPLQRALRGQDSDALFPAANWLDHCRKLLERAQPTCPDAQWILAESRFAFDMAEIGIRRAQSCLRNQDPADLETHTPGLLRRYKEIWSHRARPGGFEESSRTLIGD